MLARVSSLLDSARAAKQSTGKGYLAQFAEARGLRYDIGQLGFSEYYDYGLFDDARFTLEEKRSFAGWRLQAVFDNLTEAGWWNLVEDKVALTCYFRNLGFQMPRIFAVYHRERDLGGRRNPGGIISLNSKPALREFLSKEAEFPLFSKPVRRGHGIDALALNGIDDDGIVTLGNGTTLDFDAVFELVQRYASVGYLFQGKIETHDAIKVVCGDRLTSLRVTTVMGGRRPEVIFARWKLPVGQSMIDNSNAYGNIVAMVEIESGLVRNAVINRGDSKFAPIEEHPDTRTQLPGFQLPCWHEALELCRNAAHALSDVRVQGWDVALARNGPELIETNVTGDIHAIQRTQSEGFLTEGVRALLPR